MWTQHNCGFHHDLDGFMPQGKKEGDCIFSFLSLWTIPDTLSCTSVQHAAGKVAQKATPEIISIRQPAEVCELCSSNICCEEPHLHYANGGCSEHLRAENALKTAIDACDSKAIARYCAACPNLETSSGKTALAVAVGMGDKDLISRLLQVGGVDPLVRLTMNLELSARAEVAQQEAIERRRCEELENAKAELDITKIELDAVKATKAEVVQQTTAEKMRLRKELNLTKKELEMSKARLDKVKHEAIQEMASQMGNTQKELCVTKATLEATKNALDATMAQLYAIRAEKSQRGSFLEREHIEAMTTEGEIIQKVLGAEQAKNADLEAKLVELGFQQQARESVGNAGFAGVLGSHLQSDQSETLSPSRIVY